MERLDWNLHSLNMLEQIDTFVNSENSYRDLSEYLNERIIGQKDISLVCTNVFIYLKNIWRSCTPNNNMIITAPSGTGKTETYRALKDYFKDVIPDLPIFLIDATQLTPAGYKGSNLEDMFAPLFSTNDSAPPAIVFIDEIDKRIAPADNDQFTSAVQYNLLSILEGGSITDTRRGMDSKPRVISMENVMFIGLGSFYEYRTKEVEKKNGIGFNAEAVTEKSMYMDLTADMLLKAGVIAELVGRFPFIVNYNKLSEEDIRHIIDKNIDELAYLYDCDVRADEAYVQKLLALSDSKFGCRAIKNELQNALLSISAKALLTTHRPKEPILDITLSEEPVFTWRDYSEAERDIMRSLCLFNGNEDNIRTTHNQ